MTAGIIIIGNEILSGKVRDENAVFIVRELRELGIEVLRIVVIPDDSVLIGKEALRFSGDYDYVFTSGGIGPTHDDVTIEGIAQGFGVRAVRNPVLEERLCSKYGSFANEAVFKMALVPEGAELVSVGEQGFPVVLFRNIYILPGIPEFLKRKFASIKERFRGAPYCLRRIFLNADEADIAGALNRVVSAYPEVTFGSYPVLGRDDYRIIITAESKTAEVLAEAVHAFLSAIPASTVSGIE